MPGIPNLPGIKGMVSTGANVNLKPPTILSDGNTVARYDRTIPEGVVKDVNGAESIYWDLNVGNTLRGAEESTGITVAYGVYEITAAQTNHFFTGCAIGNIFPAVGGIVIDANNKVKRVLGNHVCQPVLTKRPINGLFDGVNDFMKTPAFSYVQPAYIWIVQKLINANSGQYIFDGDLGDDGLIFLTNTPPLQISTYAGSLLDYGYVSIDKLQVLRILFNGTNSKIQLDNNVIIYGNAGVQSVNGITLGRAGGVELRFTNMLFNEAIFRNKIETSVSETTIFNYLSLKNKTNRKKFGGKIIFTYDDAFESIYSKAFPLHQSKGLPGTFFIPTAWVNNAGKATWNNLKEMDSAGLEIAGHGADHADLTTLTEPQLRLQFDSIKSSFITNEITPCATICYPAGHYNSLVKSVASEYFSLGRTVSATYLKYPDADKFAIPGWDISQYVPHDIQLTKDKINEAMKSNSILVFMLHDIVDSSPTGYQITVSELSAIMDYCISVNAEVIRFKDILPYLN